MNSCFFVSDLHGKKSRYEALFKMVKKVKPDFLFIGGDLLPHTSSMSYASTDSETDFANDFLFRKFAELKQKMDCTYPDVFLIPGNDDRKIIFDSLEEGEKEGLWRNLHNKSAGIGKYRFYGYACVPPTPFRIKDWERFDIAAEVNKGSIAPADGYHSMPPDHHPESDTIQNDLQQLTADNDLTFSVFLFHSPPFQTCLDMASVRKSEHSEEEEISNVGSKAILNLISEKQPYLTLHGHIHESARLSGNWKLKTGNTWSFSAAHDGPELAIIEFTLQDLESATKKLVKT